MLDRDAALKAGDLTKFAEADDRLTAAVADADRARRSVTLDAFVTGEQGVPDAAAAVTRKPASWLTQRNRRQPFVACAAVSSVTVRNGHTIAR